jgi:hypothetical protein
MPRSHNLRRVDPDPLSAFEGSPAAAWTKLPDAIQALRPVALEIEARASRATKIELLDYRPTHQDYTGFLAKPGTVTLFVAQRHAEILGRIRRATTSAGGEDRSIAADLAAKFNQRSMVSLEQAVATLTREPVFASLRYGDRTLAQSLVAPEPDDVCVVPMAYNGGYLAENSFKLVEHVIPDSNAELEAVLVRHVPPLSLAERAALQAVPLDQREWSIAQPMACYAITAITVTLVLAGATYACPGIAEPEPLPDREIKKIGPSATARKLLAIRRRILEGT